MHVLICDDDGGTRLIAKHLLSQQGCTSVSSTNGAEALRAIDAGGIELVLLDVSMPVADGLEVLSVIRASSRFRDLPVIMLSRETRQDEVVKLMHLGISSYIVKPLDLGKLTAAFARAGIECVGAAARTVS